MSSGHISSYNSDLNRSNININPITESEGNPLSPMRIEENLNEKKQKNNSSLNIMNNKNSITLSERGEQLNEENLRKIEFQKSRIRAEKEATRIIDENPYLDDPFM